MKNPKYFLPIVIIPFLIFVNYSVRGIVKKEKRGGVELEVSKTINSSLPDPEVKSKLSDKFSSFEKQFRMDRDEAYSSVAGIEQEEEEEKRRLTDYKNEKEEKYLDSLKDVVMFKGKLKGNNPFVEEEEKRKEQLNQISSTHPQRPTTTHLPREPENPWEEQIRELHALMQEGEEEEDEDNSGEELLKMMIEKEKKREKEEEEYNEKLVDVQKKRDGGKGVFNTVRGGGNHEDMMIKAIIDEETKAEDGSRVRIRILEEIYIDDKLFPKNSIVYAQVSGFKAQRVELKITNVVLGGEIRDANIDVYDVDGMKGLYVPKSGFRDFTKEVGGNASQGGQMPVDQTTNQDEESRFMWGIFNNVFNTTTRALSSSARKNRAKIKYGTVIYLQNQKN